MSRAAGRSLLIVNYFSAGLAARAIESARRASQDPLQVVVVDNSCDDAELKKLAALSCDELIQAPRNLGYAGGINLGAKQCAGKTLIVSNPDVEFRADSIDLLAERISEKVALSGPRFSWDREGKWLLPPADPVTRSWKFDQAVARRSTLWKNARDRRRIRERVEFWSRNEPSIVPCVSGAVMVFPAPLLSKVGGLDERFHLYFEEIDFMRRVRQAGFSIAHVPSAGCRHLYNQSAGLTTDADDIFAESEQIYHRKWSGGLFLKLMSTLPPEHLPENDSEKRVDAATSFELPGPAGDLLIEASPLRDFDSAAGHFPEGEQWSIPEDVWQSYKSRELFVRVIARDTSKVIWNGKLGNGEA